MKGEWLNETLYDIGGKVRVELAPQLHYLECNDENLDDSVTPSSYKVGKRDAKGRVIMPERVDKPDLRLGGVKQGEKMAIIDRRAKFKPHVWRVYRLTEVEVLDNKGQTVKVEKFLPVGEDVDKETAISQAESLAEVN